MDIQNEIIEIEIRAKRAKVLMKDLCKAAGIHYQTYQSWKHNGAMPRLDSWHAFNRAIDDVDGSQTDGGTA